jgi:glycosyltransferase involved in cell wall biosynthesis
MMKIAYFGGRSQSLKGWTVLEAALRKCRGYELLAVEGVSHEKALELMKSADIVVLPSQWPEPLSRIGIEACSYGKAQVCSDRGGNFEHCENGKNGFLCANSDEMARSIQYLIDNPEICRTMGKKGRELFERKFRDSDSAKKLLAVYKSLAGK